MNIIDSRKIYTKNTNTELDLGNFLIVFNSNLGYDEFDSKLMNNYNKS
jgi:ATP-dependent Clp protease ATP-binding subunit ClpA